MRTDVIVLNGGSSSGKSSLARRLQELLEAPWIVLGVDDLLAALPPSLVGDAPPLPDRRPLLRYGRSGQVIAEAAWSRVEAAWYRGLSAMARAGLGVILDDVLIGGGVAQQRVAALLDGLVVTWVGVRCDPAVAAAREAGRPDRIRGMAASQAVTVHDGVHYDVLVDTTSASSTECARTVLAHLP
jgi:chloramphenicol 3-O phosphotransferase